MTEKTILQKTEQDYPQKVKDAYTKALEEELRATIAKLESQIEKMKNCNNCRYQFNDTPSTGCINCIFHNKWEL